MLKDAGDVKVKGNFDMFFLGGWVYGYIID